MKIHTYGGTVCRTEKKVAFGISDPDPHWIRIFKVTGSGSGSGSMYNKIAANSKIQIQEIFLLNFLK